MYKNCNIKRRKKWKRQNGNQEGKIDEIYKKKDPKIKMAKKGKIIKQKVSNQKIQEDLKEKF